MGIAGIASMGGIVLIVVVVVVVVVVVIVVVVHHAYLFTCLPGCPVPESYQVPSVGLVLKVPTIHPQPP
jgi:hypothetical protein